jgi:hypothetical protein
MSVLPNAPFDAFDAPQLAAFVVALKASSHARSTEQLSLQLADEPCASSEQPLGQTYGEVGLLRDMLLVRIAIRDVAESINGETLPEQSYVQKCWRRVASSLMQCSQRLPDPVFVHMAALAEKQSSDTSTLKEHGQTRLLAEITEVLLRVQEEVFQNSNSLQERCIHITIHFNGSYPLCVTH